MVNYKKNAQTWGLGVIAIVLGVLISLFLSMRLCMTDSFLRNVADRMDLAQVQVRKVTGEANLAAYIAMMLETPGLDEQGIKAAMDDPLVRDFMYEKMKDYRTDVLSKNSAGKVTFDEIRTLYYENEDHFNEIMGYSISEDDLEKYQLIWWTLAITERSCLDYMRFDHQGMLTLLLVVLSPEGFILGAVVLAILGFCVWKKYKESFKGMGIYGFSLWLVGLINLMLFAMKPVWLFIANGKMGIKGNLVDFFVARFSQMMLLFAVVFFLVGFACNLLCLFEKKLAKKRAKAKRVAAAESRIMVVKKQPEVQQIAQHKKIRSKVNKTEADVFWSA